MSMLAKAAGTVFGSIAAVYGSVALYTFVSANGEVSQRSQREKKAQSSLRTWQTSLQTQERVAVAAEAESKVQETVRTILFLHVDTWILWDWMLQISNCYLSSCTDCSPCFAHWTS